MESIQIERPGEAAVSIAPPATRPVALPLSRRATEPVRRPPRSVAAIVTAWAIAIVAIAVVCKLV